MYLPHTSGSTYGLPTAHLRRDCVLTGTLYVSACWYTNVCAPARFCEHALTHRNYGRRVGREIDVPDPSLLGGESNRGTACMGNGRCRASLCVCACKTTPRLLHTLAYPPLPSDLPLAHRGRGGGVAPRPYSSRPPYYGCAAFPPFTRPCAPGGPLTCGRAPTWVTPCRFEIRGQRKGSEERVRGKRSCRWQGLGSNVRGRDNPC